MHRLYEGEQDLRLVLLDGHTGSAKTEILGRLAARGVQVLDLEGLADHRGSLFGAIAGRPQPSQKLFESRLIQALDRLDPTRPIVVEAESSKIGERMTPPLIWRAMQAAPRIELRAPRDARARYLVTAYRDVIENRAELEAAFARLPVYPGQKRLGTWRELADAGSFEDLATALMEQHYDPAYDRSSRKDARALRGLVEVIDLNMDEQERAADEIVRLIGRT